MKNILFLYIVFCIAMLAISCNFVTLHRHINVDLDDNKNFEQTGTFSKTFDFYSHTLINAISENIDAKNARIENLQIESLQIAISLNSANTATSIHNVHIKLKSGWGDDGASLVNLDTARISTNKATVFIANTYLVFKGVEKVKEALLKNLVTNVDNHFTLEMSGFFPSGQVFSGNVKLILEATMDAVTCEKVPFGLGPSECMILPIYLW